MKAKQKTPKGVTEYSSEIKGTRRNYNWPVRFDYTDGFIGIYQEQDNGLDGVLLSLVQVKELIAFVKRYAR